MKSELFARIISIVSETTELPEEAILSQNKSEECVARTSLVCAFLLYERCADLCHQRLPWKKA